MPIRPSERRRYPADWPAISARIRERAGNRCEAPGCGAPNGVEIVRSVRDPFRWMTVSQFVDSLLVADRMGRAEELALQWARPIRVVLTVAHLDHAPEHNDEANLRALCQRCHLTYDARHHASTARETRARRSGQLALVLARAERAPSCAALDCQDDAEPGSSFCLTHGQIARLS